MKISSIISQHVTLNVHLTGLFIKKIGFILNTCLLTPRIKVSLILKEKIKDRDSPLSSTAGVRFAQGTEGRANFSGEGLRTYGSSLLVASRNNCFCSVLEFVFVRNNEIKYAQW